MRLITDANIIVAALLKTGRTRKLLTHEKLHLILPPYVLEEIRNHFSLFTRKTGLVEERLEAVLALLTEDMECVPEDNVKKHLSEAESIMQDIDPDDAPILAVALATECDGIWSDDKHFQRQDAVPVWRTNELYERLREAGRKHKRRESR